MNLDVICVGSVMLDTIAAVPRTPGEDGRAVASALVVSGGGPAATAAVALARLGARVGICGVIGDDHDGILVCEELEREGVRTDWLTARPGTTTARSIVVVSESSSARMIITQQAGRPEPRDIPVGESVWLHVDQTGFHPTRHALAGSRTGPLLSVDAGNPIDTTDLAGIDLYVPTVSALLARYPSSQSVRAAIEAALSDGARSVVATDGANGSIIGTETIDEVVPAFAGVVASTLGAGDVFHGALLAGLLRGQSLVDAARESNAAAALSCRALDGRSAIPTREELDGFLGRSAKLPALSN